MASIFSVRPGITTVIRDPEALPMSLDFTGWGGFIVRRSIVQGITVQTQSNYQFVHTLRGFVYVYVFGERIGDLIISGLSFSGRCPGDTTDGIKEVMNYYDQQRVSFAGNPTNIRIGRAGFRGFLVGAKFEIVNPKGRVGQFQLRFNVLPPVS